MVSSQASVSRYLFSMNLICFLPPSWPLWALRSTLAASLWPVAASILPSALDCWLSCSYSRDARPRQDGSLLPRSRETFQNHFFILNLTAFLPPSPSLPASLSARSAFKLQHQESSTFVLVLVKTRSKSCWSVFCVQFKVGSSPAFHQIDNTTSCTWGSWVESVNPPCPLWTLPEEWSSRSPEEANT